MSNQTYCFITCKCLIHQCSDQFNLLHTKCHLINHTIQIYQWINDRKKAFKNENYTILLYVISYIDASFHPTRNITKDSYQLIMLRTYILNYTGLTIITTFSKIYGTNLPSWYLLVCRSDHIEQTKNALVYLYTEIRYILPLMAHDK